MYGHKTKKLASHQLSEQRKRRSHTAKKVPQLTFAHLVPPFFIPRRLHFYSCSPGPGLPSVGLSRDRRGRGKRQQDPDVRTEKRKRRGGGGGGETYYRLFFRSELLYVGRELKPFLYRSGAAFNKRDECGHVLFLWGKLSCRGLKGALKMATVSAPATDVANWQIHSLGLRARRSSQRARKMKAGMEGGMKKEGGE